MNTCPTSPIVSSSRRRNVALVLAGSIAALIGGHTAQAATLYWDNNTTGMSGNPPTLGGASGNANWSVGSNWWTGTACQAWADNNVADFRTAGGAVRTVTIATTNVTADGLVFSAGSWVLASSGGAVLTLNNVANNFNVGTTSTISATLAGYLNFTGASGTSGALISGTNTGVLATNVNMTAGGNFVRINNASALGSASATVKVTSGALGLDNVTAGVGISCNAWATDLAGGAIRVRNFVGGAAVSTWNGAISLSADSAISVRATASVGLIVANTVNLNGNTLTVSAGNNSSGVDFQSAISGTGSLTLDSTVYDVIATSNAVVKLSAANTFSGTATTTANIGNLALNNVNALQNATLDTGATGSQAVTFAVAGTNTYNIGALAGSDALAIGGNTISVGAKAVDTTFAADISGGGGLTKVGGNSLTLSAATSFSGATAVNNGTLALTGAGAVNSSTGGFAVNGAGAKFLHAGSTAVSPVVTLTQGTLTGSGTVDTVNVGAATGGIISK